MKLGLGEIILIVIVIGMVFGVGKIPEMGKQLGRGVRDFKKYSSVAGDGKASGPAHNPVITTATKTTPLSSNEYPHEPFSKN